MVVDPRVIKRKQYQRFIDLVKANENIIYNKNVADVLGIDPRNLASYKTRGVPKSWIQWYCHKYNISLRQLNSLLDGKSGLKQGEKSAFEVLKYYDKDKKAEMNEKDYLLELQRERIENLEEEVFELEQQKKIIEEQHWDTIEADFDFKIDLKFDIGEFCVKKRFKSLNGLDVMAEKTGYSIEEMERFYPRSKWLRADEFGWDRPLYTQNTLNTINDNSRLTIKNIKYNLKQLTGDSFVFMPITVIGKNGDWVEVDSYNKFSIIKKSGTAKFVFRKERD